MACSSFLSYAKYILRRTLAAVFVDVLLLPLRAVKGTALDIFDILGTWKRYALEYEASYRRQQVRVCYPGGALVYSLFSRYWQMLQALALVCALPAWAHPLYALCIIVHLAGCQVEASRRAYKAAQSPKESEALKKQADDRGLTRRRPAPLKVGVEDAAPTGAGQTKRAHRSSATKTGMRLRPIPSSSVQVEQQASQP